MGRGLKKFTRPIKNWFPVSNFWFPAIEFWKFGEHLTRNENLLSQRWNLRAQRIGAYGGTFDPIHLGHIEIARAVVKYFALDELLVIPAFKPPHKNLSAISNSLHRYEMCCLALRDEPRIRVSKMEIELPERPFTINTIERLRAEYGRQAQLFFVMGADSFAEITTWHEYQSLLASTNIIVSSRAEGHIATDHLSDAVQKRIIDGRGRQDLTALINDGQGCFIYLTDFVKREVSSTEIRRRVRASASIKGLTAPSVIAYIEEHHLYTEAQINV